MRKWYISSAAVVVALRMNREPLPVPGFGAKLKDGSIELDGLDMACVRL